MNTRSWLGAVVAFAGITSGALAQFDPVAQFVFGDQTYELPTTHAEGSDRVMLVPVTITGSGFVMEVREGWLDSDPSISWGVAFQNLTGGPMPFTIVFETPILLAGGPTVVSGSIVGGLTDSNGNGVVINPTVGPNIMINEVSNAAYPAPGVNMGVDVGPGMVTPVGPGSFFNYGSFAAGPIPGPAGPWGFLRSTVQFTLSGGNDVAVLTGYASIDVVPTPGAAMLLALGGALAARRRRFT